MAEVAVQIPVEEPSSDRRRQILDAAERRFSRAGFHRTTMQDVAAEAGMSPGNLYRYFPSKDALVAGLCERDRAELAGEFRAVHEHGEGLMAAFRRLGRKYFEEKPVEKSKLCLEIWAEATRNPAVAKLQTDFDRSLIEQFVAIFDAAKATGAMHPSVDSLSAASLLAKLGDGLFVRRATADDFDAEREVGQVFAVVEALLNGAIKFPAAGSPSESRS
jgi:TetR/AcrR family transcriptional regulator, repressor for uid operon